jgi:hypothetical protein
MNSAPLHCRNCGRIGTGCCPEASDKSPCDAYLSWSDLWAKETAAIERAQRVTYAAAVILIMLATVALMLPKALQG